MQLLLLDPRDNVAIATTDLHACETLTVADRVVRVRDDIPQGHKVALEAMPTGTDVVRYGEVIGQTTTSVAVGAHVHVHNLISKRIPGRQP
jgi:altronate hydrolase